MSSGRGKNTKYFHNLMVHNRLGTKIHRVKRLDRSQDETRGEVEEEITNYFKGIMTEENSERD